MKNMTRSQLAKLISQWTTELNNCRFRAEVISRRIGDIEKELKRPARSMQKITHLKCALAGWQRQLADAYDGITHSYLELEQARKLLETTPHESRQSRERTMVGLYRMGRVNPRGL